MISPLRARGGSGKIAQDDDKERVDRKHFDLIRISDALTKFREISDIGTKNLFLKYNGRNSAQKTLKSRL